MSSTRGASTCKTPVVAFNFVLAKFSASLISFDPIPFAWISVSTENRPNSHSFSLVNREYFRSDRTHVELFDSDAALDSSSSVVFGNQDDS